MRRSLAVCLVAIALLATACGDDAAESQSTGSTTTATTTTTTPSPSTISTSTSSTSTTSTVTTTTIPPEPPCRIVESSVPADPDPQRPEFPDARLEAGLELFNKTWIVDGPTIWVAQPDGPADGEPTTEGPVRRLAATPGECWVVDLALVADDLYATSCRKAQHDDCWVHRLDRTTAATIASVPVPGHELLPSDTAVVVVGSPGRIAALDPDLTERWRVTEPWAGLSVVTDTMVWVNQADGRRIHLADGTDADPFPDGMRVARVDGDFVFTVELERTDGEITDADVTLLGEDLTEHVSWDLRVPGSVISPRLSNGLWAFQRLDTNDIEFVDLYTGEFTPVVEFSGEPVSRSGAASLGVIDVIDGRLWFWHQASVWSIPIP